MAPAPGTTTKHADLDRPSRPIRKLVLSTETVRRLRTPEVEERTWDAPVATSISCVDCRSLYRSCVVRCH